MMFGSRHVAVTPATRPRISVAPDAGRALVVDGQTATVFDLTTAEVLGTLEVPVDSELAWIETAIIVVAGTRVRVVELAGPSPVVFDHHLDVPMRLVATCESSALVAGEAGCFVITCDATGIQLRRFFAREVPSVVGVGAGQFVVAYDGAGSIVEWDPAACKSRRTLALPRPATVRALGGTRQNVWFVARDTPSRIDVILLVHSNQPKQHDLPEPIAAIANHPRHEALWCLGESGQVYVVDLDGHHPIRVVAKGVEAFGVGVIGAVALVTARAGHPVEVSTTASVGPAPPRRSPIGRPPEQVGVLTPTDPARWRDDLVVWTRRGDARGAPISLAIAAIGARFGLRDELVPAIALGYGAHLCGEPTVPLVDVALVVGGAWEEALGRGELTAKGVMTMTDSRARIAPSICRALDELPPSSGTLIGSPAKTAVGRARAVVSTEPLAQLAERLASRLECAMLVDGDVGEARAYGAYVLTRATAVDARDAAIVVVDTRDAAAQLGIEILDA